MPCMPNEHPLSGPSRLSLSCPLDLENWRGRVWGGSGIEAQRGLTPGDPGMGPADLVHSAKNFENIAKNEGLRVFSEADVEK